MRSRPMSAPDTAAELDADAGKPPFALVRGIPLRELPTDLYIPPDALEVFLDAFEGPLDLLLYLIRRHNLDILDIPVAAITEQYLEYVQLMKALRLELAAEYLVMAAMLAEIKSRMLLPRVPATTEEAEEDPRAELVRRLREYERYKQAAEDLDALPRLGRDVFPVRVACSESKPARPLPAATLEELLVALQRILERARLYSHHHVRREGLSVRQRMTEILVRLQQHSFLEFSALCRVREGRLGVVVSFLAVLELVREALIELVQARPGGPIHLRRGPS